MRPEQFHALTIGINSYDNGSYKPLKHAVHDATQFEEYLTNDLHVPPENIIRLHDTAATRQAILDALQVLIHDEKIVKDQCSIIIFYAGHGSYAEKPADWKDWETAGGQVEMLCPIDLGGQDENGKTIEGIPDRTISGLLDDLSAAKGNNITLILDCCHSAGMSRHGLEQLPDDYTARVITNPPPLSSDCDASIWSTPGRRGIAIAQGFSGTARESHVLIAACNSRQSAFEITSKGGGVLTVSLLYVLRQLRGIERLTYASLIHRLNIPERILKLQTPHCEGKHVRRRLFNAWDEEAGSALLLCRPLQDDKMVTSFHLDAGVVQGITVGSRYNLYPTDLRDSIPLCTDLEVLSVGPFTSTLVSSSPVIVPKGKPLYADPKQGGDSVLHIFCNNAEYMHRLLTIDAEDQERFVVSVDSTEGVVKADLVITVQADGRVYFDRGSSFNVIPPDTSVPSRLSGSVSVADIDDCRRVVNAYARFVGHLRRSMSHPDGAEISMSLRKLAGQRRALHPIEGELLISEKEPVTITVGKETSSAYGMMFENTLDVPLYLYVFIMDPSSLDIVTWYHPKLVAGKYQPSPDVVDTELQPKNSLSLGFGNGGAVPLRIRLDEHEVDVTFIKVYMSTHPTDMRSLEQQSPFEAKRSKDEVVLPSPSLPRTEGYWATRTITIIQRRVHADVAA